MGGGCPYPGTARRARDAQRGSAHTPRHIGRGARWRGRETPGPAEVRTETHASPRIRPRRADRVQPGGSGVRGSWTLISRTATPASCKRSPVASLALAGGKVALLTCAGEKGSFFVLASSEGSSLDLAREGSRVAETLGGRGGGSSSIFQGKAGSLESTGAGASTARRSRGVRGAAAHGLRRHRKSGGPNAPGGPTAGLRSGARERQLTGGTGRSSRARPRTSRSGSRIGGVPRESGPRPRSHVRRAATGAAPRAWTCVKCATGPALRGNPRLQRSGLGRAAHPERGSHSPRPRDHRHRRWLLGRDPRGSSNPRFGRPDRPALVHDRNRGKGAALRTGFERVSGDIVAIQDADLEYDPLDLPTLIGPILEGRADAVYGSRFYGGPHRVFFFWHMMGNRFLTLLSNMLTDLSLSDMETCYKLIRTDLLRTLRLSANRFGFEPEVTARLAQAGARIYELPDQLPRTLLRRGQEDRLEGRYRSRVVHLEERATPTGSLVESSRSGALGVRWPRKSRRSPLPTTHPHPPPQPLERTPGPSDRGRAQEPMRDPGRHLEAPSHSESFQGDGQPPGRRSRRRSAVPRLDRNRSAPPSPSKSAISMSRPVPTIPSPRICSVASVKRPVPSFR